MTDERYEAIKGFHIYNPSKVLLYAKEVDNKECVFLELHPSTKCNHRCIWCRYWGMSKGSNLSIDYMKDLLVKYPKVKGVRISGGGEPLMNPATEEAIKFFGEKGIKIGLETNGALLNDINIQTIGKYCQYCRISLDAATKETYKYVHGKDDFDSVIENIRKLSRSDIPEIGVSYLVTKDNVDEIRRISDLQMPINYIHFKPLIGGLAERIKTLAVGQIHLLQEKIYYDAKYDRILKDYYFNKNIKCKITNIIRVIGGDGKEYVCCEHAYEPDFEVRVWDGSTEKCKQCRYNPYNEILDMLYRNTFTKEFL